MTELLCGSVSSRRWFGNDPALDGVSLLPLFRGERIFYLGRRDSTGPALLFVETREDGDPRVVLDPQVFAPGSQLDWFLPSPDGSYVAFDFSSGGDEQSTLAVFSCERESVLALRVPFASFARISWRCDSSGFYFSAGQASDFIDEAKYIYYYDISGGSVSAPEAVEPRDPHAVPVLSGSGRFLVVNRSWEKPVSAFYRHLEGGGGWRPFLSDWEGESYGAFDGDTFLVLTTHRAPRGRILAVPMAAAAENGFRADSCEVVVAESPAVLRQFVLVGDELVLSEIVEAQSRIRIVNRKTDREEIFDLPGIGRIEEGAPDASPFSVDGRDVYFVYATFTAPPRLFRLSLAQRTCEALGAEPLSSLVPRTELRVRQEWVTARDGADVPLFIVTGGAAGEGPRPLILHGYGGWNTTLAPAYVGSGRGCVLPFLEAGGVYVWAGLRGGCEGGRAWWQQGRREHKQNSFNDFYDAAEYLIGKGYTTPEQLAALGASNGGLLTAAALTQRPDLFAAVVSEVPLTDMVRALRGPFVSSYKEEYGDPDDPDMGKILRSYSPFHNVRKGRAYPAVYIQSGISDVRCQAWNGRKLAARLQDASSSGAPVFCHIVSGGHGPGLSAAERVYRRKHILGFIMKALGMNFPDETI